MQRALVLALDGKLTKEAYKYKVLTAADHHHRLLPRVWYLMCHWTAGV